jgi:hypothetical protein
VPVRVGRCRGMPSVTWGCCAEELGGAETARISRPTGAVAACCGSCDATKEGYSGLWLRQRKTMNARPLVLPEAPERAGLPCDAGGQRIKSRTAHRRAHSARLAEDAFTSSR